MTTTLSLSGEAYREVIMPTEVSGTTTIYHIDTPQTAYYNPNGESMAITDGNGLVHEVPVPGFNGAVHRWQPNSGSAPTPF